MLAYSGERFKDVRYESGKSFGSPDNEWTDIKDHMDLPFPSLPYLVDGELRLTQSNAILRYIAKRHQLCGKDPTEEAMADMVSEIANEYRTTLTRLFYNPAFESEVEAFLALAPEKLRTFNDTVGDGYFAGSNLTWVDFVMYELLDQTRILSPGIFDRYDNIARFMDAFENFEAIKIYMGSDNFIQWPINMGMAMFGGQLR